MGSNVIQSLPVDPTTKYVIQRRALEQPVTDDGVRGTTIGPSVMPHAITTGRATEYGYIQRIDAICLRAPSGPAALNLHGVTGGSALDDNLRTFAIPAGVEAGQRYVWEFPTELRTASRGDEFYIWPSSTDAGVWFILAEGFYTDFQKDQSA